MPRTGLLVALLLCSLPAAARAQTLRGHVTDRATGEPVSGATVTLVSADSQKVAAVVTDDAGAFSVTGAAGVYTVSVERLGYAPESGGPIRLRANGFAEVGIALTPRAIALDTLGVSVEAQDPALLRAGFYRRQQQGGGTFLDRAQIRQRGSRMSDVLSGLRSVRVVNSDNGIDVQLRGAMTQTFSPTGPKVCYPLIFVDGLLLADGKTAGAGRMNLELLSVSDLSGIELYSSEATVPIEFARGGGQCGALLYWTRSGPKRR